MYRFLHCSGFLGLVVFITNIAISDTLFTILSTVEALEMLKNQWILGNIVCKLYGWLIEVSYTVSILTLTFMTLDKYITIRKMIQSRRRSLKKCAKICCFIWLISMLICCPILHGRGGVSYLCSWTCGLSHWSNNVKLIYFSILTFLLYVTPVMILVLTHTKLANIIRSSALPTAQSVTSLPAHLHRNRQNRHVIRLMVMMTTTFFVLWTPFILVRLISLVGIKIPNIMYSCVQGLILLSTISNFFIYGCCNSAFRHALKMLATCRSDENSRRSSSIFISNVQASWRKISNAILWIREETRQQDVGDVDKVRTSRMSVSTITTES